VSPELLTAVALLVTAILGGGGIAALRRRPSGDASVAAGLRQGEAGLLDLSRALDREAEAREALEERMDTLERSVLLCPVVSCPVRDELRGRP
jgi:hypothetical protein